MLKIIKYWGLHGPGFLFQIYLFPCLFCLVWQWGLFFTWDTMQKPDIQCMHVKLLWIDRSGEKTQIPATPPTRVFARDPLNHPTGVQDSEKVSLQSSKPLVPQIRNLRPRDQNWACRILTQGSRTRSRTPVSWIAIHCPLPPHLEASLSQGAKVPQGVLTTPGWWGRVARRGIKCFLSYLSTARCTHSVLSLEAHSHFFKILSWDKVKRMS